MLAPEHAPEHALDRSTATSPASLPGDGGDPATAEPRRAVQRTADGPRERRAVVLVTVYRRYHELRKNLRRTQRVFQDELGYSPDFVVVWAAPEAGREWLMRELREQGLITHLIRRPEMVGVDGVKPTTFSEGVNIRTGLEFVRSAYPADSTYALFQTADIWVKSGTVKLIDDRMNGREVPGPGGAPDERPGRYQAVLFFWDQPVYHDDIWCTNWFAVCLDEAYWPPVSPETEHDVLERQWGRQFQERKLPGVYRWHNSRERHFLHRHESEDLPPFPLIPEREGQALPLTVSGWKPWHLRVLDRWNGWLAGLGRFLRKPVWPQKKEEGAVQELLVHDTPAEAAVPTHPIPVARALFMDCHGRVLLGYRQDARRWEFPGGKIEGRETAEQAACRESREECCLRPDGPGEFAGVANVRHLTKARYSLELYYAFGEWRGDAACGEPNHSEWAWLLPADALKLSLMPSARACLEELLPAFLAAKRLAGQEWPPLPAISLGPVS